LLQDIFRKLGGYLAIVHPKRGNPVRQWRLCGLDKCAAVLENLVSAVTPSKKQKEAVIALEYIRWRQSIPFHMTPEQQAHAITFVERIKDIRAFNVQG